jgi:hypothetical protein
MLLLALLFVVAVYAGKPTADNRPPHESYTSKGRVDYSNTTMSIAGSFGIALASFISEWNGRGCNPDNNPYGYQQVTLWLFAKFRFLFLFRFFQVRGGP